MTSSAPSAGVAPLLAPGSRVDGVVICSRVGASRHCYLYVAEPDDGSRHFLQEYFPTKVAVRAPDGSVTLRTEDLRDLFEAGMTQYLQDARLLSQIRNPHVAHISQYMESNGTAYVILDHEPGQLLSAYLSEHPVIAAESDLRRVMMSLLKGLEMVHEAGLYHRDLHPGHIYLRDAGPPLIMGWGTNGQHVPASMSRDILQAFATPGYAAIERYQLGGRITASTDLYSLGAILYRCMTGSTPVGARQRVAATMQGEEDPLVPARELAHGKFSNHLLGIVDWMMQPLASERPDSVQSLIGFIGSRSAANAPKPPRPNLTVIDNPAVPIDSSTRRAPGRNTRFATEETDPASQFRAPPARSIRHSTTFAATIGWVLLAIVVAIGLWYGWQWQATNGPGDPPVNVVLPADPDPPQESGADETTPPGTPESAAGAQAPAITEPAAQAESVDLSRADDRARADEFRKRQLIDSAVQEHLVAARSRLSAGEVTDPAGESALDAFRAALVLDPGSAEARGGIEQIAGLFVTRADTAFADRDLQATDDALTRAREIAPGHTGLLDLEERVTEYRHAQEQAREREQQAEATRQREVEQQQRRAELLRKQQEEQARQAAEARNQQIRELLGRADSAMRDARLTAPVEQSALTYFRAVLSLNAEQPDALDGVARIQSHYLDLANRSVNAARFDEALDALATAQQIEPGNPAIPILREQVEARRATLLAEQARERELQRQLEDQRRQQIEEQRRSDAARVAAGAAAYYQGDYRGAYEALEPYSDNGDSRAQFRLSVMLARGRGAPQDLERAADLARQALPDIRARAERGEAWAQADLGSMYEDGDLLPRDLGKAVEWYRRAADQGYAGAQTNLGVLYANGEGVRQDTEQAVTWLRKAAAQGDKIARENLSILGVN